MITLKYDFPGIGIELTKTAATYEQVSADMLLELGLAIGHDPEFYKALYELHPLRQDRPMPYTSANHPFAEAAWIATIDIT